MNGISTNLGVVYLSDYDSFSDKERDRVNQGLHRYAIVSCCTIREVAA